jgi:hypothetical protein
MSNDVKMHELLDDGQDPTKRFLLKRYMLTELEHLFTLRKERIIGNVVIGDMLSSAIIKFYNDYAWGVLAVQMEDYCVRCRLVRPVVGDVAHETLEAIVKAISYTVFKSRKMTIDYEPFYTLEEVECEQLTL